MEWKDVTIRVIVKKENTTECGDYRGISLVAQACEVSTVLVATRLRNYTVYDRILAEEQSGCRRIHSTYEMMVVIRPLQELAWNCSASLYAYSIDFTKASRPVDLELLWTVPERFGVPPKMLAIIRQLHDCTKAHMWMDDGKCSDRLDVGQGLRLRCNLAPLLSPFLVAMIMVSVDEFVTDNEVMVDMAKV